MPNRKPRIVSNGIFKYIGTKIAIDFSGNKARKLYYFLKNVIDSINSTSDNYNKFTNILEGSLVNTSDSEKIKSYSEIENEILMSGDYIPVFYKNKFVVYKKGISDFIFNPFSEQINFRYAKYFD